MRARHIFLLAALALLAAAPVARADGDPASDYLIGQRTFVPYDTQVSKLDQEKLTGIVQEAAKKGFPVRIAVIASDYDLGSVTVLWKQPQRYAKFLGIELSFIHKNQPLLTLMPNGIGFYYGSHDATPGQRALAGLTVGSGGLGAAALTAVERVAAAYGVKVTPPADVAQVPVSHRNSSDRLVLIAAVAIALALGGALRVLLRKRRSA